MSIGGIELSDLDILTTSLYDQRCVGGSVEQIEKTSNKISEVSAVPISHPWPKKCEKHHKAAYEVYIPGGGGQKDYHIEYLCNYHGCFFEYHDWVRTQWNHTYSIRKLQ